MEKLPSLMPFFIIIKTRFPFSFKIKVTKPIPKRRSAVSTNYFISQLLNLKDENITFSNVFSKLTKNGVTYNLITATLSYTPNVCEHCACLNINSSIIKYGFKTSTIKLLPINGQPTMLKLKKQRFLCKYCNHTFISKTNIVKTDCFISNQTKTKILADLQLKISEKDIAHINYVSHSTVSRTIDTAYTSFCPDYNYLPEHLMFDEFKSTKDSKGAMSFIFANATNHQIIDIVESRQLRFLRNYFIRFSKVARDSVKSICIDIYSPYMALIKELFKNADIIIDRFHIINLLSRALTKTRIDSMKSLPTNSMEYKRLKRYWKLFLKDASQIDSINFKNYTHFKNWVSEATIINESISADDTLQATYQAYQRLLYDIKSKNIKSLQYHLHQCLNKNISQYMKTAISTLIKHINYIINALTYKFSNGAIEGINNYIKVLKRIAFGYRSFFHFRNRILIAKKLIQPIQKYQVDT